VITASASLTVAVASGMVFGGLDCSWIGRGLAADWLRIAPGRRPGLNICAIGGGVDFWEFVDYRLPYGRGSVGYVFGGVGLFLDCRSRCAPSQ